MQFYIGTLGKPSEEKKKIFSAFLQLLPLWTKIYCIMFFIRSEGSLDIKKCPYVFICVCSQVSTQINPSEPNWTQLNPTEPNWTQLNQSEPNGTHSCEFR